jgi:hypothetical protein
MLASLLYPYDDDAAKLIDKWIGELEREHCICRYVIEDTSYAEILNWSDHQKIDRPSPSKIPKFDEASRIIARPREASSEEGKGREGTRKGREGTNIGNGADAPVDRRKKAFRNYNVVAASLGLAQAEMLTKTRSQQIDARLKEVGLAGWNQALHNLEEMPFCRGENDRGWKVNLDWLLKPANLTKILEKHYEREEKSA